MGVTRNEIRVDQEFDPVQTPIATRSIKLTTSFAEMSPDNLQAASGLGTLEAAVAAGSGTRGHQDLTIDNTLADSYNSWGFDIAKPDGEAERLLVYKGRATGSPSPQFTPENPALIDLEITALVDTSTTPSRIALVRDIVAALP